MKDNLFFFGCGVYHVNALLSDRLLSAYTMDAENWVWHFVLLAMTRPVVQFLLELYKPSGRESSRGNAPVR
jgi:hypothetical protein